MSIDLKGKRALVGGSTQGIGRAIAIEFAKYGASVTLIARNEKSLAQVANQLSIEEKSQYHEYLVADFSHPETVREKIENYVLQKKIHILVNNTGGPSPGPILNASPDEFSSAFSQHLICNQILSQAIIPGMKDFGYGRIINIISTSVKEPIRNLGVSNTVRWAVASWAKTLAGEVGAFGITVNNVLPGYTDTGRLQSLISNISQNSGLSLEKVSESLCMEIPRRRFATPDEIANAVCFLASPLASYITGVNLPVDGGRSMSL